jgi:hypothetical protein
MKYNHNQKVLDFQDDINIILKAGFKPIAVSQLYLEDTFVFETSAEAKSAYNLLENSSSPKLFGWWYGKKDFLKTVEEYENEYKIKVLIHWLNDD